MVVVAHFALLPLAQEANTPVLNKVLEQLQRNRDFYIAHIPSMFCHEHVVAQEIYEKHENQKQLTVADSTFQLKRVDSAGAASRLVESRESIAVFGVPTSRTTLGGPVIVDGAFSRGLDVVDLIQKHCVEYSADSSPGSETEDSLVVKFNSGTDRPVSPDCLFSERVVGRIIVDRHAMQVVRMEVTFPRHLIRIGLYGQWKVAVDYKPIQFGEASYWLPQSIDSTLVPVDDDQIVWSFDASYDNYHKYEVTSRIVPFQNAAKP